MALSAFDDKLKKPGAGDLEKMLGRTSTHWDDYNDSYRSRVCPSGRDLELRRCKVGVVAPIEAEKTHGFAHDAMQRTLAWARPSEEGSRRATVPDSVLSAIDEAPKYAEGRGVGIEVRNEKDREIVKKLAAIKMAN